MMRRGLHLYDLDPQTHCPSLTMRKTSDKLQQKDSLHNTQLELLRAAKVIKSKEKPERPSQPRGASVDPMMKQHVVPRAGFWTGQRTLGEN